MGINQSRPECTSDQCLKQVIGLTDGNGFEQFQACVSTFGQMQESVTV